MSEQQVRNGQHRRHVAVVGGGLGGLTAAIYAARSGAQVTLFERAGEFGGQGRTVDRGGYLFNVGAHALYQGGPAGRVLEELGIAPKGSVPSPKGSVVREGALCVLPSGPLSMLAANWLGPLGRIPVAKVFATLPKMDTSELAGISVSEWARSLSAREPVQSLLRTLSRLATYCDEPDELSAQVLADQLKLALDPGVLYLDGGWATLVEQLRGCAARVGVEFNTSTRVTNLEQIGTSGRIRVETGETSLDVDAAVLAVGGPRAGAALLGDRGSALLEIADSLRPVRAAAMDLGFRSLPKPKNRLVLSLDKPLYLSSHTPAADLAPSGCEVVHIVKYLGSGEADARADRQDFEELLDLAQPGWRDHTDQVRFLAELTVAHGMPQAAAGGYSGRPSIDAAGVDGVFIAGDWVGNEGVLVDASMASARFAGTSAALPVVDAAASSTVSRIDGSSDFTGAR